MKRIYSILLILFTTMILSSCSLLEGANQTLQYADQAKAHLNELASFADQAPQMIKDAASDPETKNKLEARLNELKGKIEQFNRTDAPSIAAEIHGQLVEKNNFLLSEINKVVVNGHLALDQIQNSQIITTINDINSLKNRIENLGL